MNSAWLWFWVFSIKTVCDTAYSSLTPEGSEQAPTHSLYPLSLHDLISFFPIKLEFEKNVLLVSSKGFGEIKKKPPNLKSVTNLGDTHGTQILEMMSNDIIF